MRKNIIYAAVLVLVLSSAVGYYGFCQAGYVKQSDYTILPSATLNITLWDSATGGTMLWSGTATVTNSKFDACWYDLPDSLLYGQTYYIDVSVDGEDLDFGGSERKAWISTVGKVQGSQLYMPLNIDSGTLYVDAANDRVGIGTTSPDKTVVIKSNDGYSVQIYAEDSGDKGLTYDVYDSSAWWSKSIFTVRRAFGTKDSPQNVSIGTNPGIEIGGMRAYVYFNDNWQSAGDIIWRVTDDSGSYAATRVAITSRKSDGTTNKIVMDQDGNVGIGTASPSNILTVQQNSATDPIADSWTVYSTQDTKEIIGTADDEFQQNLEIFEQIPVYKWKRKFNRLAAITASESETSKEGEPEIPEVKYTKKFSVIRYGLVADDNTPDFLKAYDDNNNTVGIDLYAYVGFLHEVVRAEHFKIKKLEQENAMLKAALCKLAKFEFCLGMQKA